MNVFENVTEADFVQKGKPMQGIQSGIPWCRHLPHFCLLSHVAVASSHCHCSRAPSQDPMVSTSALASIQSGSFNSSVSQNQEQSQGAHLLRVLTHKVRYSTDGLDVGVKCEFSGGATKSSE